MRDLTDSATARYGLAAAPDGLFLVQELLNTEIKRATIRDLLADAVSARSWLDSTMATWAQRTRQADPGLTLTDRDLPRLLSLRDELRRWLVTGEHDSRATSSLALGLGAPRAVSYSPNDDGVAGLRAVVLTEVLVGSRTDVLRRLKVCPNTDCGAAFFDESPAASRRWHDVKTCGNAANLRASRARRGGASTEVDPQAVGVRGKRA